MTESVSDVLALRERPSAGLSRAISGSFTVHLIAVVALVFGEQYWAAHQPPPPKMVTISLGGSPGPRSTGMTAAGARPVDQVAPEPKRPEPIKPASSRQDVMSLPITSPPKRPPQKVDESLPITPAARPPTTGREKTQGTSLAETGSRSMDTGQTIGGGGGSTATVEISKIEPYLHTYLDDMLDRISRQWNKNAPERGETTLKFTILRDGQITAISTDKTTSPLLELQSEAALTHTTLAPLPSQFPDDHLVIHLRFPYGI